MNGERILDGGGFLHGAEQTVLVHGGFLHGVGEKVSGCNSFLRAMQLFLQAVKPKVHDREGRFHRVE